MLHGSKRSISRVLQVLKRSVALPFFGKSMVSRLCGKKGFSVKEDASLVDVYAEYLLKQGVVVDGELVEATQITTLEEGRIFGVYVTVVDLLRLLVPLVRNCASKETVDDLREELREVLDSEFRADTKSSVVFQAMSHQLEVLKYSIESFRSTFDGRLPFAEDADRVRHYALREFSDDSIVLQSSDSDPSGCLNCGKGTFNGDLCVGCDLEEVKNLAVVRSLQANSVFEHPTLTRSGLLDFDHYYSSRFGTLREQSHVSATALELVEDPYKEHLCLVCLAVSGDCSCYTLDTVRWMIDVKQFPSRRGDVVLAPGMKFPTPRGWPLVSNIQYGCKFDVDTMSFPSVVVQVVFAYFSFGELLPLILFARRGDGVMFKNYWCCLLRRCRRFRLRGVENKLWRFIRSQNWLKTDYRQWFEGPGNIVGRLAAYCDAFVRCFNRVVEQGSLSEAQGPLSFVGKTVIALASEAGDAYERWRDSLKVESRMKELATDGASDMPSWASSSMVNLHNSIRGTLMHNFKIHVDSIIRKIIMLDAAIYFAKEGDWARAFGQCYLFLGENFGILRSAADLFNSTVGLWKFKKWNLDNDLDEEDAPLEITEEGDVVMAETTTDKNLLTDSSLWKKLCAMIAAVLSDGLTNHLPGGVLTTARSFSEALNAVGSASHLANSITAFTTTFMERLAAFLETWDWREFMRPGDFSTLLERGVELCSAKTGVVTKNKPFYPTMPALIEALDHWMEECKPHIGKTRWTQAHHAVWSKVLTYRNAMAMQYKASKMRDREPFNPVTVGAPGCGKTVLAPRLGEFVVQLDTTRPKGADGRREVTNTDVYTVPADNDFWVGCSNPKVVAVNDIPGDGFVNTGMKAGPHTIWQQLIDRAPFQTPQASIEDKANAYIDPDIVYGSTNASVWEYSVFSKDNRRLLRRLRHVYYVAYPAHCYERDIMTDGDDHGVLKDQEMTITEELVPHMRYYKMAVVHQHGNIRFFRRELICVGLENFVLHLKGKYLEHVGKPVFNPTVSDCCCMLTPWEMHVGSKPCLPGCDVLTAYPPMLQDRAEILAIMDAVQGAGCSKAAAVRRVDNFADNVADRAISRTILKYSKRLRKKFLQLKKFVLEYRDAFLMAAAGIAGLVATIKLIKSVGKKQGRIELVPKTPTADAEAQAVIMPTDLSTPLDVIERYGVEEAKARQMPAPPKWVNPKHSHAFLAKGLENNSFEDVSKRVFANFYTFVGEKADGTGSMHGKGVFLDGSTFLCNSHVARAFKGPVMLQAPPGVDPDANFFRMSLDLKRSVHDIEMDLCLVRTSPFPGVRSIWGTIPKSVGIAGEMHFPDGTSTVAKMMGSRFKNIHGIGSPDVWVHKKRHEFGDCGTPMVLNTNGGGLFVGIHVALMYATQDFAALVLLDAPLRALNDKLKGDNVVVQVSAFYDHQLQPLPAHSELNHFSQASMVVLGSLGKSTSKLSRSKVRHTRIASSFMPYMTKQYVAPRLHLKGMVVDDKWISPTVHKSKGFRTRGIFDRVEVDAALHDYFHEAPVRRIAPLTIEQAVNGVVGDPLIKAMNLTTSPGIYGHFVRSKSELISRTEINADLKRRIWALVKILEHGPIFLHQKWARKDEPTAFEKDWVLKFRYFMVSDPEILFVSRQFLGPAVGLMYENKEFFECFGAFNPASPEFGKRVDEMKKFLYLLMADMSHMDSSHRMEMADAVAEHYSEWLAKCGYNEFALKVVRNLIRSVVLSIVELLNDVALFSEGMGSGIYLTFLFNCLTLSVLYRIAWLRLSKDLFRKHNVLSTGGDDSMNSTDNPKFTGVHIQKVFLEYGYVSTPPTDKAGVMSDFFPWSELVFLKRSPVDIEFNGVVNTVGALAEDSILKSLSFEIPSRAITSEQRLIQVCDAAQREYALHGKIKFDEFHSRVSHCGVNFKKMKWEEVMIKYYAGDLYEGLDGEDFDIWCPSEVQNNVDRKIKGGSRKVSRARAKAEHVFSNDSKESNEAAMVLQSASPPVEILYLEGGIKWIKRGINTGDKICNAIQEEIFTANTNTEVFIGSQTNTIEDFSSFSLDLASTVSRIGEQRKSEATVSVPTTVADMKTILERPVLISSFTWDTAPTPLAVTAGAKIIAGWSGNRTISRYLSAYQRYRGKPRIICQINGSPFVYGKMVFGFEPLPGGDPDHDSATRTTVIGHGSQLLQTRHISVDASEAVTYILDLPWVSTGEWNLNQSAVNNADWKIWTSVINPLSNYAKTDTLASVKVQLWVQMLDVELSIPAQLVTTQGESGVHGSVEFFMPTHCQSELDINAVSKSLASVDVGAVGGALKVALPSITPILSGVKDSLQRAGYASVPIVDTERPVIDDFGGRMAPANAKFPGSRIVIDSKQGLRVDSEAASCGDDGDVMLLSMARRWGLFEKITWAPGPSGTLTGNYINYQPIRKYGGFTSYAPTFRYDTPLGFVSNMFKYASGSLEFRFEVVCSPMHRGSLMITMAPIGYTLPGVPQDQLGTGFMSKVIDLAQSRTADLLVPYSGPLAYNSTQTTWVNLAVTAVVPLASQSTSSVEINVYVRAGEDFEFKVLDGEYMNDTTMLAAGVQSFQGDDGYIILDGKPRHVVLQSANGGHNGEAIGSISEEERSGGSFGDRAVTKKTQPVKSKIYFGENYTSFKQIFSRGMPTYYTNFTTTTANDKLMWSMRIPRLPIWIPGTIPLASTSYPLWNPLTPIEACFAAARGGYRFRTMSLAQPSLAVPNVGANILVGLNTFAIDPPFQPSSFASTGFADVLPYYLEHFLAGCDVQNWSHHNGLEIEFPDYNPARFRDSRGKVTDLAGLSGRAIFRPQTLFADAPTTSLISFVSVADDWSVHEFVCIPGLRNIST